MKNCRKLLGTILALSMMLSSIVAFADAKFTDIEAGTATETAVSALVEKGIISGYPDGTFKPEGAITRAEFAAVITRFKGITAPADAVTGFADLDADTESEWARPYVKAAVDAGIINGFSDGTFKAAESVTYEQAIKMLICALGYQELADQKLMELEMSGLSVTWSSGYITVAEEKDITVNAVAKDVTAPATRGIVAILTGNALVALTEAPGVNVPAGKTIADRQKKINEKKEMRILSFGNSYTDDSFKFLSAIAAEDGISVYAVNMFAGSCSISKHYNFMKGDGVYTSKKEYMPDGTVNLAESVPFDDAFAGDTKWDYITLHQRGQHSPFFEKYHTAEKPYLTELSKYITRKSPDSELLMFESWCVYTDRIEEKYEDVYKPLVEGLPKEQYLDTVYGAIKSSYLKAAETIGNPGRAIPAGEAIYQAIREHGIEERIMDGDKFVTDQRSIYRDESSHLTKYGRVLSALTWYEYLTGNDVRENSYVHESISPSDMELLKDIAHDACSLPEFNPVK